MNEETQKATDRNNVIEPRVAELGKYLRDWAVVEPEISLILGNVRRLLGEVYDGRESLPEKP